MKTFTFPTFFTLLFVSSFSIIHAQTFPYVLELETDNYEDLQGATILNSIGDNWSDEVYTDIPIGFDFEFYGDTFNLLEVNGTFLSFLSDSSIDEDTLNVIRPYFDYLTDIEAVISNSQSTISYLTEGIEGERIFKIEWKEAGFEEEITNLGTANNRVSLQVWFHESSNDIEYRYGPSTIPNPELVHRYGTPVCGIVEGWYFDESSFQLSIKALWYLFGNSNNPIIKQGNFSDYVSPSLDGIDTHPSEGQVYRFTNTPTSTFSPNKNNISAKIYPNLVQGHFYVEVDQEILKDETQIIIFNQFGQEILNKGIKDSKEILDVSNFTSGLYHLTILNKNGSGTKKFVKQ